MQDMLKNIFYKELNSRQQEIYNFQKVSAVFADFGFATMRLSDDWNGADFIAVGFDGKRFLKVQLKGSLHLAKKYQGKDLYICFFDRLNERWYLYKHDAVLEELSDIKKKDSWGKYGYYRFSRLSEDMKKKLLKHNIFPSM